MKRMKKRREKKAHQYLDAMRPTTRINVPIKRNRKERGNIFQKKENAKRKEAINTWTSTRDRSLFVVSYFVTFCCLNIEYCAI